MKNKIFFLITFTTVLSCKSIEKMVDKGQYNQAFEYAISKLQGQKNKNTKYVKALEKAYSELVQKDLYDIKMLSADNRPENWERVISIYEKLERRQFVLAPILPLVSEDNYRGSFAIVDYSQKISLSENKACDYYYSQAVHLLDKAKAYDDKSAAQDAFYTFEKIHRLRSNFKDVGRLKEEARQLGLITIEYTFVNEMNGFRSYEIARDIQEIPVSTLDDFWHDHMIGAPGDGIKPDYTVVISLYQIAFSPERERVNTFTESNDVVIKKEKVKEVKDSIVTFVEKDIYKKVKATVIEVFREKEAEFHGAIKVFNHSNNEYIKTIPINVFNQFTGYASSYHGDERALSAESKNKLDGYCEQFPSDYMMASDLSLAFKNTVLTEAKRIRF